MANYTIRLLNTGFIGGGGGKNEPNNFYNYHFSLYELLEKKGIPLRPSKRVCNVPAGRGW